MAGELKIWLDAQGRVLVDSDGRVYYSDHCCCLDESSSSESSSSSSTSGSISGESSSSASISSSASSSSSSSGSGSSSSAVAGYIQCTKHNEQPEYPITFDGAYNLVSGNPNDTSGVWRHADGHEIYYQQGNWICHVLTGYWAGYLWLTIPAGADRYDPTTWTYPHCASELLAPAFDTSVDFCFVQTSTDNNVTEDDVQ